MGDQGGKAWREGFHLIKSEERSTDYALVKDLIKVILTPYESLIKIISYPFRISCRDAKKKFRFWGAQGSEVIGFGSSGLGLHWRLGVFS